MPTAIEIIEDYIDRAFDDYDFYRLEEPDRAKLLWVKIDLENYFIIYHTLCEQLPERFLHIEEYIKENFENDCKIIKELRGE